MKRRIPAMSKKTFAAMWLLAALIFLGSAETDVVAQTTVGGFTAVDVGDVGQPGSTSESDGTFFIAGAGGDIWAGSDAFRFVYQEINGDGEIYALVEKVENTNPYAKAGLMMRQLLDPDSSHAILDVKPDGGIEFMRRRFTNDDYTTFIAGASATLPVWLKLSRSGTTVTASIASQCCNSWTPIGTTEMGWVGVAKVGMAVTSHDTSTLNHSIIDAPTVTRLLPPWTDRFFYQPVPPDEAAWSFKSTYFTIPARGADIWGTSDSFHYVEQAMDGDTEIVARVVREANTNTYAKAGVMMRGDVGGDVGGGDPTGILDVKPDGFVEFMARPAPGANMSFITGGFAGFPAWLKLVRSGDQATAYTSTDGTNWLLLGRTKINLSPTGTATSVGMAVTSHDPNQVNTATIDNVSVDHNGPSLSDIVIYGSDIANQGGVHGAWQTIVGDPTSPDQTTLLTVDNGWATLDAPLANPNDYIEAQFDTQVPSEYHVWLRLLATNDSKWNDSVWVQFSDGVIPRTGSPAYPIGSTDALLVNLENCYGCGLSHWGFQDHAWWLTQPAVISLPAGHHMIRIQVREDGAMLDEVILSPSRFMTTPPGPVKDSTTWVTK
jgi:hypothetical protein